MNNSIKEIQIFSSWNGFADPSSRSELMVISNVAGRFERLNILDGSREWIDTTNVENLVKAVKCDPLSEIDHKAMGVSKEEALGHYESFWTDDCPSVIVKFLFSDGDCITIHSNDQHAFMIPWEVNYFGRGVDCQTKNITISRSLSALLPKEFLNSERLAGFALDFPNSRSEIQEDFDDEEDDIDQEIELSSDEASLLKIAEGGVIEEILQMFKPEAQPEKPDKDQQMADLRSLIEAGTSVNVCDDVGSTALMHAGYPPFDRQIFDALVAAGADVEARRDDGATGIQIAAAGWMSNEVAVWIAAGSDINARTPDGATVLMHSAPNLRVTQILCNAGADVSATDNDGDTAAIYVVDANLTPLNEKIWILRELVRHGLDLNIKNKNGKTSLDFALTREREEKIAELVHKEFSRRSPKAFQPIVLDDQHGKLVTFLLKDGSQ